MVAQVASLAGPAIGGEQTINGAHRAEILAFVEQRGMDRLRRGVDEALAVEDVEQRLPLAGRQGQGWRRQRRARRRRPARAPA